MTAIRELYQEIILDHGRKPRNFHVCMDANHIKEGFNPLCGDQLTLYVTAHGHVVEAISFQGSGCAISMASASLMTEVIQGKKFDQIDTLFHLFHQMATSGSGVVDKDLEEQDNLKLGKLVVLRGVCEYPSRVKCATLAWHTLMAAIKDSQDPVSTENM